MLRAVASQPVTSGGTGVAGVSSFNARTGAVTLTGVDINAAGGALLNNPVFTGDPRAPTAAPGDADTSIATTAFVANAVAGAVGAAVTSFNTRTGAVVLTSADITSAGGALLASPVFTGDPRAPTAAPGDNDTSIATTQFVTSAIAAIPPPVTIADAAPTLPAGGLWWDSLQGQLYVRYQDPDSGEWVSANSAGISDAPNDANTYGRHQLGWTPVVTTAQQAATLATFLPLGGGTLSGPVVLAGNAATSLQAVPLQQLNAAISSATGAYVPLAGGTMSGGLSMGSAVAPAGPADLSRHIALWGSTFGFSITGNQINYNVATGSHHVFYAAGSPVGTVDINGFTTANAVLGAAVHSTGDVTADNVIYSGNGPALALSGNFGYRLARNGSTGEWDFVEGGTTNFKVETNGNATARSGLYAPWLQSTGSGSVGTDWTVGNNLSVGNIAYVNGQYLQCQGSCWGVRYASGAYNSGNTFLFGFQSITPGLVTVSIDNGGYAYAIANASDARMKTDIAPSQHDCLATVRALPVREYRWRDIRDPWKLDEAKKAADAPLKRVGLVAQDVHRVFPDGVIAGEDHADHLGGVWQLDQNNMIALLIGALQQATRRIEALEGAR